MKGKRLSIYKRIVSIVLCFAMLLVYAPMTALAADPTSGTCGDGVNWRLEGETLIISGTGPMTDYDIESTKPWEIDGFNITSVVIEENVTSIGSYAFYDCNSLNSVTIAEGVTSIGSYAFYDCDSLNSVTIAEGVTSIGDYALYGCKSLTTIKLPRSIRVIGGEAFYRCAFLTTVELQEGIEWIGRNAFGHCYGLSEIKIPDSVRRIENGAFYECKSLTTIEIPDGVESIASNIFNGCTGLNTIEIPNSVTSIGSLAFMRCTNLNVIHYLGTSEEWEKIVIDEDGNSPLTDLIGNENGHFYVRVPNDDGQTHVLSCTSCGDVVKPEPHDFSNGKCICGEKATLTVEDFVFTPPADCIYTGDAKAAMVVEEDGIAGVGEITVKYYKDGVEAIPNQVGSYKVQIHVAEGDDYKEADLSSDNWAFDISYLSTDAEATLSGTPGTDGWYTDVTLSAPDQFTISVDGNTYGGSVDIESDMDESLTYYLKDEVGYIALKTIAIKKDASVPTVRYRVGADEWKQFVNRISFGLFYKEYKTVEILAADAMSGVQKIEYYVADGEKTVSELAAVSWNAYTGVVNLDATGKYIIYVRVTDKAGNVTEGRLATEGIVIYEDSTVTSAASREYKAGTGLQVEYALKGNTFDSILFKGQPLTEGSDADYAFAANAEAVTFTQAFLDTLEAGTHEFTFVFQPQGETTPTVSLTQTFTLTVTPAPLTVVGATATDRDYDGTKEVIMTGLTLGGIKGTDSVGVLFENLTGVLSDANVGTYTSVTLSDLTSLVALTGEDKDNYSLVFTGGAVATDVTISKATATDATVPVANHLIFDASAQALVTAGVTNDGIFMYSLSENGEYTASIPTAIEIGDYTVWYYVKGDANHTDSAKAFVKVTIAEGPHIENDEGKMGWDAILDEVEDVLTSEEENAVVVDMNGQSVVPADVLEELKGKDIEVKFNLGDGIVWTVNGADITGTTLEDIDFAVTVNTEENPNQNIPVSIINKVTGEKSHVEISLAHDGEFGFTAVLTLNLNAENAGLFANLYYYNPTKQAMEFICADEIAADGSADLTFTHASDYTIVIDEVAADADDSDTPANPGEAVTPGGPANPGDVQPPQTGDSTDITFWAMLLMAGLGLIAFGQKRRVR